LENELDLSYNFILNSGFCLLNSRKTRVLQLAPLSQYILCGVLALRMRFGIKRRFEGSTNLLFLFYFLRGDVYYIIILSDESSEFLRLRRGFGESGVNGVSVVLIDGILLIAFKYAHSGSAENHPQHQYDQQQRQQNQREAGDDQAANQQKYDFYQFIHDVNLVSQLQNSSFA